MYEANEAVQKLFNEIKVTHGIKHPPLEDIQRRATEEWFSTHDKIPTIEEIDAVIEDYRREVANNAK